MGGPGEKRHPADARQQRRFGEDIVYPGIDFARTRDVLHAVLEMPQPELTRPSAVNGRRKVGGYSQGLVVIPGGGDWRCDAGLRARYIIWAPLSFILVQWVSRAIAPFHVRRSCRADLRGFDLFDRPTSFFAT